jgi:hypothetical protein
LLRTAVFAAVVGVCVGAGQGAPPFHGTIFIDPDIITPDDPTTFLKLTDAGHGKRKMFDRRVDGWIEVDAYLFIAHFDKDRTIEVQVNPEFGSTEAAMKEAEKFAPVIGRLPAILLTQVETVWIHQGEKPFGGGNKNLLIHVGQADKYLADGILEETLVHEAAHTSLDGKHAAADGWLKAQREDGEFISKYARDNPKREDIAESYLPYLAIRHRRDRIKAELAEKITRAMPHRIEYFDAQSFDVRPIEKDEPKKVEERQEKKPGASQPTRQ